MRIEFDDDDLRRLYVDAGHRNSAFGPDLTRQFRKKVAFLQGATDERDLYNYRALRYEKLSGGRAGQHSIRLNRQWRLIVRHDRDELGPLIVILEIVDYH